MAHDVKGCKFHLEKLAEKVSNAMIAMMGAYLPVGISALP
jgi:hypothetical protein